MACLATFDFDAIKAESEANDFRPASDDNDDDVDLDKVHAIESQMKNTLMEFKIDPNSGEVLQKAGSAAANWAPDMAESHLKDIKKEAAKARKLLKEVESGLNNDEDDLEKERESWLMTTTMSSDPQKEISLTEALVGPGRGIWDQKDDEEEEGNLETRKIKVVSAEGSAWEEQFKPGVEEAKANDKDDNTPAYFDWGKQRRVSRLKEKNGNKKSKSKMKRQQSVPNITDATEEVTTMEGETAKLKKTKKKSLRRTKSEVMARPDCNAKET